ncbi:hypothetical protein [Paenibacillus faecalis]|uniref:hypothetical protein n=1 Tax=Paenibacillus faecalis TaxID=2079532 RepID=UPI0018F87698|nr:hypothetical protein [Paenibacillus faecalis]
MIERQDPKHNDEPTVADGMEDHDEMLQEDATEEEIEKGDFTEVTQLVIDRTPEE